MKVLLSILALIVIVGLGWMLTANQLAMQTVFAPKFEEVRHTTFKQSTAFNDGMAQELGDMQREYIKATDEQKAALKSIILHRTDSYDVNKLPTHLQQFVLEMRE